MTRDPYIADMIAAHRAGMSVYARAVGMGWRTVSKIVNLNVARRGRTRSMATRMADGVSEGDAGRSAHRGREVTAWCAATLETRMHPKATGAGIESCRHIQVHTTASKPAKPLH